MNDTTLKIAIAEPSVIIRSGLSVVLKRVTGLHIQTFEITTIDLINNYVRLHKPDILIINPAYWGAVDVARLKQDSGVGDLKCFALTSAMTDPAIIKQYDDEITTYDTAESIREKLNKLFEPAVVEAGEENETLSQREKEILVCVVKGQTNKEIAQDLFLSTHTVITHRRNIARKLEIHSTAGLTIYAIVNKLVELDEIKKDM
ncbi:MAG: transcriptional regulator [Bacteroidetes bacterium]|jgi:DNA-binding NarL/FixJ family response regulator|nr:transcriptional regulator [Bacteroidota bacterium]